MPDSAAKANQRIPLFDMCNTIQLGIFQLDFQLYDSVQYPDAAETVWRGALGHALRPLICHTPQQSCGHCLLRSKCAFSIIFDHSYMRLSQKQALQLEPPPPLTLYSLSRSGQYHTGDILSIELVLVAEQHTILPALIRALETVNLHFKGNRLARAELKSVTHTKETEHFSRQKIWDGGWQLPQSLISQCDIPDWVYTDPYVQFRWCTPALLKQNGSPIVDSLSLHTLMTVLLRRHTVIQAYWTTHEPPPDSNEIADWLSIVDHDLLQFTPWSGNRRSGHQKRQMHFQGIDGECILSTTSIKHLLALLWVGQWLHLGKGASFGMGRYQLLPVTNPLVQDPL